MIEKPPSCAVAPHTNYNHATLSHKNATGNATTMQPLDLIALSTKIIERNQCNQLSNSRATNTLHSDENNATETFHNEWPQRLHSYATNKSPATTGLSSKSCAVASYKGSNHATHGLRRLIEQVSKNYGDDDPDFLSDYINTVIREWSHDLDAALKCFSDLST